MPWVIATLFLLISMEGVSGASTTTQFNVHTTVSLWLEYQFLKETLVVKLTKGDVKKGFKDADSNTIIKVTTNNPSGYVVSLHCETVDFFISAVVTIDNATSYALLPGGVLDIPSPYHGLDPDVRQIDIRFNLSPTARAGEYPWPIAITLHPA